MAAGGATMLAARTGGMALSGGAATVRTGAAAAGAASTAYRLGAIGHSGAGGIASGMGSVANATASGAISPLRRMVGKAAGGINPAMPPARRAFCGYRRHLHHGHCRGRPHWCRRRRCHA